MLAEPEPVGFGRLNMTLATPLSSLAAISSKDDLRLHVGIADLLRIKMAYVRTEKLFFGERRPWLELGR
jgi:hypothetical protein